MAAIPAPFINHPSMSLPIPIALPRVLTTPSFALSFDMTANFAFLGLSFKSGTDDLRESPTIKMISIMKQKGFKIFIYDNKISLNSLPKQPAFILTAPPIDPGIPL